MKILFICKHNRFRSKVAESIFDKLNKKSNVKAESRGIKIDSHPVAELVIKVMNELNYSIADIKPNLINDEDIKSSDKIIVVADNINTKDFPKDKTEVWAISDCSEHNEQKIRQHIAQIKDKVRELIGKINNINVY